MFENFEKENDTRNIFRTTRNMLNWKMGRMSLSFLWDGKLERKPAVLANIQ